MTEFEIIDLIRRKQGGGDGSSGRGRAAGDVAVDGDERGRATAVLAGTSGMADGGRLRF